MTEKGIMVLCIRVEDEPEPFDPSEEKECCACHFPVWVDKNVLKIQDKKFEFICRVCIAQVMPTFKGVAE